MNQNINELKPQQVSVEPNAANAATADSNIITYQPILQPILDKNDGKYYTFLDYNIRACLCLNLKDKQGNILLNNEGKPKVFYRYYLKSELKPVLQIGQSPFLDPAIAFTFYTKFDKPQFLGQKPSATGYYSNWISVRDTFWVINQ